MNTELLREDERGVIGDELVVEFVHRMQARLIEEREENKRLYEKKFHPRITELEAELGEERKKSFFWKEEARRYCQNSDYWTTRLENAEAELAEARKTRKAEVD